MTRGAAIRGLSWLVPEHRVTNEDLVAQFGTWTPQKIEHKTGIRSRPIAREGTVSQWAIKAGEKFFAEHPEVSRDSIDMVVLCTETPDYRLPATACLVHHGLGLRSTCGAFDFNLGCSAYCYGLALCKGFITSGLARRVLFFTGDLVTRYINPMDKSTRPIFGDGFAVTLVEESAEDCLPHFDFGTDGSGAHSLIIPAGGLAQPVDGTTGRENVNRFGNVTCDENLYMDGRSVLEFALQQEPLALARLLEQGGHSFETLDLVVFHQATLLMLEKLRDHLAIPAHKFVIDLADLGNTVSSTIPIALARAAQSGRLKPGMNVLLSGFGVGLSWSSALIKWAPSA